MNPAKWEAQLSEKFGCDCDGGEHTTSHSMEDLKAFIRETLSSHQAEMVRKLESLRLEMLDHECVLGYCPHYPRIEQNNQVLDAAIALIKSNPIV